MEGRKAILPGGAYAKNSIFLNQKVKIIKLLALVSALNDYLLKQVDLNYD